MYKILHMKLRVRENLFSKTVTFFLPIHKKRKGWISNLHFRTKMCILNHVYTKCASVSPTLKHYCLRSCLDSTHRYFRFKAFNIGEKPGAILYSARKSKESLAVKFTVV